MKLTRTRTTLGAAGAICAVSSIITLMYAQFGEELILSPKGAEIIGNAEGCRRDPYKCPADVLTVGIGSTAYSGQPVDPKHRYTDLEIAERWKNDIQVAEKCVLNYGNGRALPQSVFDAMVSVTFNNGCGKVKNSTMFGFIRRGRYIDGCNQLPNWVYVGKKKIPGLVNRREKEKALCLSDLKQP